MRLTPEREKEIRDMLHKNTFGYLSTSVDELFAEIDELREESQNLWISLNFSRRAAVDRIPDEPSVQKVDPSVALRGWDI